jgi:hypothetical protein
VSGAASALRMGMQAAMLAHAPLLAKLGGAHVFEEVPRGAQPPFVTFSTIDTRDRSDFGLRAHEHFVTLEVRTNSRARGLAEAIVEEIEVALDDAPVVLAGHALIDLRLESWVIQRDGVFFGARLRFRAATEPLP